MTKAVGLLIISLIIIIQFEDTICNENFYTSDQKNVYYVESEQKFSWYNALAKCASMNMSLITIDTKQKSDDVTALLQNIFGQRLPLWMGGCHSGNNPIQFVWISTGKKFVFSNWAHGQPDFAGNQEYCAQVAWTNAMEWNDHVCGSLFGFMCEYSRYHTCEDKLQKMLDRDGGKEKDKAIKTTVEEILRDYKITNGESKTFRDIVFNIYPNSK